MIYPKSVNDVNKYLKKKGVKEILRKGKGYYYFTGGNAAGWYTSSVSVYRVSELSLDQWYEEWKNLAVNENIKLKKLLPEYIQYLADKWSNCVIVEQNEKYKIYCDMDGVLTDFDKQLKNIGMKDGHAYEDKYGTEAFWSKIDDAGLKWWSEMSWMPDGKKLWNYIKDKDTTILSAPAKRLPQSRKGKEIWVNKNLDSVELILRHATKKKEFAKPNSILIDDMIDNIRQWNAAGGIGILHKSANETIKKLRDLGI